MNKPIKIIIIEDEPVLLRTIQSYIANLPAPYEVVGTAENGQEGLEKIRLYRPHIVITDIQMPMMDGLCMIKEAQGFISDVYFIILSGFAEFEYARTALSLNVANYLLKPLDYEQLESILHSFENTYQEKQRTKHHSYIQGLLSKHKKEVAAENPLLEYHLFFIFSYYGCITNNLDYEYSIERLPVPELDNTFTGILEAKFSIQIHSFKGKHYNEYVYAFVSETAVNKYRQSIVASLRKKLECRHSFLNLVVSDAIPDGLTIEKAVNDCYFTAIFQLPFGRNNTLFADKIDWSSNQNMAVTPTIKQLTLTITSNVSRLNLEHYIHELVKIWDSLHISQFQLQFDTRFIIGHLIQMTPRYQGVIPSASDIISTASSYEELSSNYAEELLKLFHFDPLPEDLSHKNTLALDVRNYIDKNFTKPITYKNFYEVFGYNEKYITSLFKANFSVSPSKYIIQLRMHLAKQLMADNPHMLLREIAEQVGYSDPLYFSRVFKNSEGISPSAFIKSNKSN